MYWKLGLKPVAMFYDLGVPTNMWIECQHQTCHRSSIVVMNDKFDWKFLQLLGFRKCRQMFLLQEMTSYCDNA